MCQGQADIVDHVQERGPALCKRTGHDGAHFPGSASGTVSGAGGPSSNRQNKKFSFGYIFGFGFFGSFFIFMLVNLVNQSFYLNLYGIVSILGYCISPIIAISFLNVFVDLKNVFGTVLLFSCVLMCAVLAYRFLKLVPPPRVPGVGS